MESPGTQPLATTADGPRPRRVLLVEDDADQRALIAWMLRTDGWDVVEAESGVELLDWIGAETSTPHGSRFEAIVSDVNMPDLTALEVLGGWRYGGWSAPLILVTASTDARVRGEAHALGAWTVLTKPIRPEELRRALERELARHRESIETPDADAPPPP